MSDFKTDKRPLKVRCLEIAIKQIKTAETRSSANAVYRTWEVFKEDPKFSEAIKKKLLDFKAQEKKGNTS